MSRRRSKRHILTPRLSDGPLPRRLAPRFVTGPLVFSDASRLSHGGLGLAIYASATARPLLRHRTVPLADSNALELQAAVFGLIEGARHFPDEPFALFTDNLIAAERLAAAKAHGIQSDPDLLSRFPELVSLLASAHSINWVQGHASARGNLLADEQARAAARGDPV